MLAMRKQNPELPTSFFTFTRETFDFSGKLDVPGAPQIYRSDFSRRRQVGPVSSDRLQDGRQSWRDLTTGEVLHRSTFASAWISRN